MSGPDPDRKVQVTGLALLSAAGPGTAPLADAVFAGKPAFAPVTRFDTAGRRVRHAAHLPGDPRLGGELARVVDEAVAGSGLDPAQAGHVPLLLALHSDERTAATVAEVDRAVRDGAGLTGVAATSVSACTASSGALADAAVLLTAGRADAAVVAAGYLVEPDTYAVFDAGRRAVPRRRGAPVQPRPARTAARRRGGRGGPGVGRRRPAARCPSAGRAGRLGPRRRRPPRAAAPHRTAPGWPGRSAPRCARAGVAPAEVGYVNANGTGSPLADAAESRGAAPGLRGRRGPAAGQLHQVRARPRPGGLRAAGAGRHRRWPCAAGRLPVNAGYLGPDRRLPPRPGPRRPAGGPPPVRAQPQRRVRRRQHAPCWWSAAASTATSAAPDAGTQAARPRRAGRRPATTLPPAGRLRRLLLQPAGRRGGRPLPAGRPRRAARRPATAGAHRASCWPARGGDTATALAIGAAAAEGRRVPPLLFFQSNPNAVARPHRRPAGRLTRTGAVHGPRPAGPGALRSRRADRRRLLLLAAATAAEVLPPWRARVAAPTRTSAGHGRRAAVCRPRTARPQPPTAPTRTTGRPAAVSVRRSARSWPADPQVGAGNVLTTLAGAGRRPGRARCSPSTPPVDGHPAWQPLTLRRARPRGPGPGRRPARRWASGPRDPVAVCGDDRRRPRAGVPRAGPARRDPGPGQPAASTPRRPPATSGGCARPACSPTPSAARRWPATTPAPRCCPRSARSARATRTTRPAAVPAPPGRPGGDHPLLRHHRPAQGGRALARQPVRGDPPPPRRCRARRAPTGCSARCRPRTPPP